MTPLVEVDRFRNYSDAAVAKALLEGAGIRCVLADANSSDLFSGCLGATRVEVAAADVLRARELLEQSRALARTRRAKAAAGDAADDGASDAGGGAAETCLSCGAAFADNANSCAACGFTFEGEETHLFANGPLPDSLLARAFTPADSSRFVLPAELVQRHVDWCVDEGLVTIGWETWVMTTLVHRLDEQCVGDAGALCLAARSSMAHGDRTDPVCFSPTTAAADAATADDSAADVTPPS
jgi:Putative prokaryotic signal transducing protein